ncbi:MAG TPA: YggS family pyridoxal phosphate-dependent enzyme [Candidatus Binataceae bacterium]|nr:YggS family pyridoxal phosphate-dependent enzyme [Candidatus Binataceae bacterium]
MLTAEEIAERLAQVRERMDRAARRAARAPATVRLVLASKTQPAPAITAAYQAGARLFGENYVQEALDKQLAVGPLPGISWHLIGHLQTNKARAAAAAFDLIESLDSIRLAQALAKAQPARRPRVLIEVNLGAETSKTGIAPAQLEPLIAAAREVVDIAGLMAIPPAGPNPEASRPYFASLRELRERLVRTTGLGLSELSMGMTDDFEIAIEEGATIVRVGRAVFGERLA